MAEHRNTVWLGFAQWCMWATLTASEIIWPCIPLSCLCYGRYSRFSHTAVFVLTLFNSLAWNWILNLCFLFQGFSVVPGLQQYLFEPPRNIPSTISINSISIKLKHICCLYTLSVFLESTKTKYFFCFIYIVNRMKWIEGVCRYQSPGNTMRLKKGSRWLRWLMDR